MNHTQRCVAYAILRHFVQRIGKHISEFCAVRIDEADLRPPRQSRLRKDSEILILRNQSDLPTMAEYRRKNILLFLHLPV